MIPVTDPAILSQLNDNNVAPALKPVTDPDILSQLNNSTPAPQPERSEGMQDIHDIIDTVKGGWQDAVDVAKNKYAKPEDMPAFQALTQKMTAGTETRQDYERMLMEGLHNTVPGKVLGAAGGLIPEAAIVNTALNKWINPAVANTTGLNPEDLAIGEMALGSGKAITDVAKNPTYEGVGSVPATPSMQAAGNVIAHPINTAGSVISGAAGAAATVARPIARSIIEGDNPITGEPGLKTALASDTAQKGAALGQKMGIQFSAGELTGDPTAMNIEDALANSARYGGKFAAANDAKTSAIVDNFNNLLDQIHGSATSPSDVGSKLSDAYNSTIDSLFQTRRAQAAIDFSEAYKNAQSGEDGQYIHSNNLFSTLHDLKDEGDARLLTASKAKGGELANALLSKLSTETAAGNSQASKITIQELGNGLSDFSEAATRPQGAFDTADSAATRRVYSRLYGALQKDLDTEIHDPQGDPTRAMWLAKARDNYAATSNKIADIQKTTLGNIVGNAAQDSNGNLVVNPEQMAQKFNNMQPTEIKSTLDFLDRNHPDVANMARRYTLEQALQKAQDGQGLRGVGTTKPFAKAQFVQSLPAPDKLNAILGGDTDATQNVNDVASAMNRLIDYGAQKKGSQTAMRTDFLHSLASIGKGVLYKSIVSDSLADDLMNPAKRQQMAIEARQASGKANPADIAKMPPKQAADYLKNNK